MAEKRVATIYDYLRFMSEHCKNITCSNCPASMANNTYRIACLDFMYQHTDEYNEILLKWCDDHPIKTYKDDFFEKFPNAYRNAEGRPTACRQHIYDCNCDMYDSCDECWNQPYESEDEE